MMANGEDFQIHRIEHFDPERQEALNDLQATLVALAKTFAQDRKNIINLRPPIPYDAKLTEESLNRAIDLLASPTPPETPAIPIEEMAETIRSLVDSVGQNGIEIADFQKLMTSRGIELSNLDVDNALLFAINNGMLSVTDAGIVTATHPDLAA